MVCVFVVLQGCVASETWPGDVRSQYRCPTNSDMFNPCLGRPVYGVCFCWDKVVLCHGHDPVMLRTQYRCPTNCDMFNPCLDQSVCGVCFCGDKVVLFQGHDPVMLRTQYRCHPTISAVSNSLFYQGQLVDGVTAQDRPPVLVSLAHFISIGGLNLLTHQPNTFCYYCDYYCFYGYYS